jgi:hypothetical protein
LEAPAPVRRAVATKEREINMVVKDTDVDSKKMEIMIILAD